MDKMVFYFCFNVENNDEESDDADLELFKGFICENIDFSKSKYSSFKDFEEHLYDDLTEPIESKYGVHDWSSAPSGVNAIGYTTYEIEEEQSDLCMKEWVEAISKAFPGSNVSKVYHLNNFQTDKEAMQQIEGFMKSEQKSHRKSAP